MYSMCKEHVIALIVRNNMYFTIYACCYDSQQPFQIFPNIDVQWCDNSINISTYRYVFYHKNKVIGYSQSSLSSIVLNKDLLLIFSGVFYITYFTLTV